MVIKEGKYLSINTDELSQDVLYTLYDLFGEPNDNVIVTTLFIFKDLLKFNDINNKNVIEFLNEVVKEGDSRKADIIIFK